MECKYFPIVTLSVYGNDLVPSEIDSLIGTNSSHSHFAKEKHVTSSGKILKYPTGAWIKYSSDICQSEDLRDHLNVMLKIISGSKLSEISTKNRTVLSLAINDWRNPEIIYIGPEDIQLMARMGIAISFEVYDK